MNIGIDIGSTTTKAVLIGRDATIRKIKTKASDVITSATGALGKLVMENGASIGDIKRIVITGVGSTKIKGDIFGIETLVMDEIRAIGIGGLFISHEVPVLICNIGTGTAMIEADESAIRHVCGTGVGGGTIIGLSKRMLATSDIDKVFALARSGDLRNVDLTLGDIVDSGISFLKRETTASNFAKLELDARDEDIALGIINMVYQVTGILGVLAAKNCGNPNVTLTGNAIDKEIGKPILASISEMYGIGFRFVDEPEYVTALGAALSPQAEYRKYLG